MAQRRARIPEGDAAEDGGQTLPDAIREISRGLQKLRAQGLNRRAVEVLLADACTAVGKPTVRRVLDGLADLEKKYCR